MKLFIPNEDLTFDQIAKITINAALKDVLPDADWESDEALYAELMELCKPRLAPWFVPRLSAPNEIVGVTLSSPKTASLIFDRVWSPHEFGWDIPEGIAVNGATQHEILIQLFAYLANMLKNKSENVGKAKDSDIEGLTMANIIGAYGVVHNVAQIKTDKALLEERVRNAAELTVCLTLGRRHNMTAIPLYTNPTRRPSAATTGDRSVLFSVIRDVALVDEKGLQWDQVNEFRNDSAARSAYRRFLHWLDASMLDKSPSYIVDEVSVRLESYEWALRKHGIQTVIGAVEAAFDERAILMSAIGAAVLSSASPVAALSAALAIMGGKMAIGVSRALLELQDAKVGPNSEVAYVHVVKKELGDG